jgi:hypothetical protein
VEAAVIDRIAAIDPQAADWLANLLASADGMQTDPGKNWRGGLMGAFAQHDINDAERHLLCVAAFGHESSKDLTPEQCKALVYWLNDGGDRLVAQICAAALKAQGQRELPGMDPVEKAAQELGAIVRDDNIMKGESEMNKRARQVSVTRSDELPHLKTVSVNYERKFNLGDYNSATIGFTAWADIEEGDDLDAAIDAMWEYTKEQVKAQALPLLKPDKTPPQAMRAAAHPANIEPAPPQPAAPAAQAPQASGGDGTKSGVGPLTKITVDADGKVEFHVGSFRWPFKDGRGAEVVAGLFDSDLGWTPAHFAPGAKYDGDQVLGLVVEWAKPGKYYDVVRVRKA